MKMIFLEGGDGGSIPIMPDIISHVDNCVTKDGEKLIGFAVVWLKNGLNVRVKGNRKEIGHEINRQIAEQEMKQ